MKKKYIKPIIIIIETCNDDCNMVSASLYDINKVNSIETIADEDDEPIITYDGTEDGIIWND